MNKISMETRDQQWYKPNLLYNIHWRPPNEQEIPVKTVETVQFNPSVCTCGQHDCKPRYRMEKRVLWSNKEMPSINQKTEEKDELVKLDTYKSKQNESRVGDEEDVSKDEERHNSNDKIEAQAEYGKSCTDGGVKTDGDIEGDVEQSDGSNLDYTEKNNHGKSGCNENDGSNLGGTEKDGIRENVWDSYEGKNVDSLNTDGENHGGGKKVASSKRYFAERTGKEKSSKSGFDNENGGNDNGLKTDGKTHGVWETVGGNKYKWVEKISHVERSARDSDDENSENDNCLKTNGKRHTTGGYDSDILIENDDVEISVCGSDMISDAGCARATVYGDRYSFDDASESGDDERQENLQVQNERENYEDCEDDISPHLESYQYIVTAGYIVWSRALAVQTTRDVQNNLEGFQS